MFLHSLKSIVYLHIYVTEYAEVEKYVLKC